ncbi:oxidoreductase [Streptomyces sp. NPDC003077]|uniref:oxidoreductase n=1 Tax=Streptomyces sp. NPDC003077 TaxID=3154443 RepID=UPI0033BB3A26
MPTHYATFGLAPAMRAGGVLANGVYQAHRDFLDFIIDGRPLLLRLADLDAVSPLAADLGPTLFTAHVRGLLLESEAPLAGGRHVLYGCPECAGLECGAVTAVIERDGTDIVWRDFAWQTGESADLAREGYPGVGPFRFRGDQYRAELERLLSEDDSHPAPGAARRVLLIGHRTAALGKLAAALRGIGVGAEIVRDAVGVSHDELRSYGAVVFERGVGEERRTAVRKAFLAAGSSAVLVDGLAPVVPLLVAQIEQALDRCPQDQRRLLRLAAVPGEATLALAAPCRVRLTAYRVGRVTRARPAELFDAEMGPGEHRVPVDVRATKGEAFVVARTTGSVLVTAVAGEAAGR